MDLINKEQFIIKMGTAMNPQMIMSAYYDRFFECSCGELHMFQKNINILAEGGSQTIIIQCPVNPEYFTLLKIKLKWLVAFKEFEYVAGYHTECPDEFIIGYKYALNK